MLNHTVLKAIVKLKLLQLDLSADLGQLLLDVLGISLGSLLLQLGVRGLNQLLGLHQGSTGQLLNGLDDLHLVGANVSQDDVKLGLLLLSGSSSAAALPSRRR